MPQLSDSDSDDIMVVYDGRRLSTDDHDSSTDQNSLSDCSIVFVGRDESAAVSRPDQACLREVSLVRCPGGAGAPRQQSLVVSLRRSLLSKYDRIRSRSRFSTSDADNSTAVAAASHSASDGRSSDSDVQCRDDSVFIHKTRRSQDQMEEPDISIEFIGLSKHQPADTSSRPGCHKNGRGKAPGRMTPNKRRQSGICVGRVNNRRSAACCSFRPCYATLLQNRRKRLVVVDGANIAYAHGRNRFFSVRGIELTISYLRAIGLKSVTFLSASFLPRLDAGETETVNRLVDSCDVVLTPSRKIDGVNVASYDDRYIVMHAMEEEGVILSCDRYRDVALENPEWKATIDSRLLIPVFIGDKLILPPDPLGRFGPSLEEFLTFPS